jgi:AcrR family transcriptional regulator
MSSKLSTKEQIVKVASDYFSEHGYDATSLESVAKVCGISKPAIYYHFKDKSSLYEAVLVEYFQKLSYYITQHTIEDDPKKNLKMYIRIFGDYLISHKNFCAIFSREIANDAKTLPDSCIVELSKTLETLVFILKDGEQKGVFKCENPFMIQMMVVTTLSAYLTTKDLRKRVSKVLSEYNHQLNPHIDDLIDNLTDKIIKALEC